MSIQEDGPLITQHEVLFATAAATRLPSEDRRWALFRRNVAALALRNDVAAQKDSRTMAREMPRL